MLTKAAGVDPKVLHLDLSEFGDGGSGLCDISRFLIAASEYFPLYKILLSLWR